MTTVVNNPGDTSDAGGGMGFLVGMVLLVIVVFIFFAYGMPYLRQGSAPAPQPNVNVPDKIDVNVQPPQQPAK